LSPLLNFHDDTLGTGRESPPEPLRRFGTDHFTFKASTSRDNHWFLAGFRNRETTNEQLVKEDRREMADGRKYLIQFRIKRRRELAKPFANLRPRPCAKPKSERGFRLRLHKARRQRRRSHTDLTADTSDQRQICFPP
jgi:hypothetical protein